MAAQGDSGSSYPRETAARPRIPDYLRDPINAFGKAIPGPEERQSRIAWGTGQYYRVMKDNRAYRFMKDISRRNMESQRECAKQILAASKLKHEVSFLRDALEIFRSLFDLQNCLPVWEVTDTSHFKQLRDAIDSVHQAAKDLNSSEMACPPDFLVELYFSSKTVSKMFESWTKPSHLARNGGRVLGLRPRDSNPRDKKLRKDADKPQVALLLNEITERLGQWTIQIEQNMQRCLIEARTEWRIRGEEEIQGMLGCGKA